MIIVDIVTKNVCVDPNNGQVLNDIVYGQSLASIGTITETYYIDKTMSISVLITVGNPSTTNTYLLYDNTTYITGSTITSDGAVTFDFPYLNPGVHNYIIYAENTVGVTNVNTSWEQYPGVGRSLTDYSTELNTLITSYYTGNTYYIDPGYGTNGNGSLSNPYNSWSGITMGGWNKYYQLTGTTYTTLVSTFPSTISGPCVIGAYGTVTKENRPVIKQGVFIGTGNFMSTTNNLLLRDIEIQGIAALYSSGCTGIRLFANTGGGAGQIMNDWIYNCHIHNFSQCVVFAPVGGTENQWWDGAKVLYSELGNSYTDILYFNDVGGIEIGHNYFYKANQSYFFNPNESVSEGDCVQANKGGSNQLVINFHHNTFDRTDTKNKFAIIWGDNLGTDVATINNNHFLLHPDKVTPSLSGCSGMYFGAPNSRAEIYNNIFEDGHFGIYNRTASSTGCTIHHNIFMNNNLSIGQEGYSTPQARALIYNNIIIDYMVAAIYNKTLTCRFINKNNYFTTSYTGATVFSYINISACEESDYNHYNEGRFTTSYDNLTEWKDNTVFDDNSLEGDPFFTGNINKYYFMIDDASPLYETGTPVGLTTDFAGNTISGVTVSKGLYEI